MSFGWYYDFAELETGALTEQYVCQQLVSDCGLVPYYWSAENSSGEIDFLVQDGAACSPWK